MNDYAMLLLALIENVSEVQWQYKYFDKAADGHGEFTGALTAADATAALNGTDIKNFGKASADVQSLLDRMEGSRASENTVSQLTAAVDLTNLDAAVSDAILSENASHFPPGDLVAEAHTVLGTEENGGTTTVYAMAMYRVFGYAGSGFTNTGGSHSPVAITFDMNEAGEYVLSEYWMPGDGSDYGPSVRAKFPPELYTDALDTQKYVTAHIQACYAQAIEFGKVSVSGYLKQVLETICSSPSFSSNARDYIDAHPIAYRELIYYGQYTLDYCFALFEQGGQTGLSGHIMASACRDIIGAAASVDTPVTNGQEWYDTYKATVRQPTAAFSQYNNGDFLNSDDDIRYTDSALLKNDFDGDGNTDALSCHISRSESNDANNPTLVTLEFAPGQPVTDARDGSVSAGVVDFDTPVIYEDTRSGRVSVGVVDFNTDDPYLDIYIFSLGANSAASVATYRYDGKQLRAYLSFEITQDASFWYDTQGSIIYEGTYEGRSGISIMLDYISGQLTVID